MPRWLRGIADDRDGAGRRRPLGAMRQPSAGADRGRARGAGDSLARYGVREEVNPRATPSAPPESPARSASPVDIRCRRARAFPRQQRRVRRRARWVTRIAGRILERSPPPDPTRSMWPAVRRASRLLAIVPARLRRAGTSRQRSIRRKTGAYPSLNPILRYRDNEDSCAGRLACGLPFGGTAL